MFGRKRRPLAAQDAASEERPSVTLHGNGEVQSGIPPHSSTLVLATLGTCMAAHSYAIASMFSYSGFLAVDAGWSADRDSAGHAVGILAAALPLARVLTFSSLLWGLASDRFGRRICLILSMAMLTLFSTAFGVGATGPLYVAVAIRFMLGAGNGIATVFGRCCGLPESVAC